MERKYRKAINFDLSVRELGKYYRNYRKAYYDIKKFFRQRGFDHRQGSGYVSRERLGQADIADLLDAMSIELPWMGDCVTRIDVTNIGRQHDLKDALRGLTADLEELLFLEEINTESREDRI